MTGESGIIALCPCHDVTFIFAKYEYKTLKVNSLGHLTMVTLATWCFSLPLMWLPYFSGVDFDYGDIALAAWWHWCDPATPCALIICSNKAMPGLVHCCTMSLSGIWVPSAEMITGTQIAMTETMLGHTVVQLHYSFPITHVLTCICNVFECKCTCIKLVEMEWTTWN